MRPLLALGLALLLMMVTRVPGTEATFGLTIAAAGATPVVFTAAQVTAIAGVAILAKAGKYFIQVEFLFGKRFFIASIFERIEIKT